MAERKCAEAEEIVAGTPVIDPLVGGNREGSKRCPGAVEEVLPKTVN